MDLDSIRAKIDQIDTALLALLALRAEQSVAVKQFKKPGAIRDAAREEKVRQKWSTQATALGLEPDFALHVLDLLLIESRRLQES